MDLCGSHILVVSLWHPFSIMALPKEKQMVKLLLGAEIEVYSRVKLYTTLEAHLCVLLAVLI